MVVTQDYINQLKKNAREKKVVEGAGGASPQPLALSTAFSSASAKQASQFPPKSPPALSRLSRAKNPSTTTLETSLFNSQQKQGGSHKL